MGYRLDLGIDKKFQFGTEMEFNGVNLLDLQQLFIEENCPVRFVDGHSKHDINYKDWILDTDGTVTEQRDGSMWGGELSSKILRDRKEDWIELKTICMTLKKAGAVAGIHCSNQVTVDLSYLRDTKHFLETLIKVLMLYETEMETFYMGECYKVRETKDDYARSLGLILYDKMKDFDFNDPNYLYYLCERIPRVFHKYDGINLQKFMRENLMEVRYPNGTVNESVIQNNVHFTLKLVMAIDRGIIDLSDLDRKLADDRARYYEKLLYKQPNQHDFYNLVEQIGIEKEDVLEFRKQYEGVVKSKRL